MPMLVKFYQSCPFHPENPENPENLIQTYSHFVMPMLVKFYQSCPFHPENPENPENPDSDIFTFCHANVGEILSKLSFSS